MPRLTVTLSDAHHRALKEAAVRTNKSIGKLIEESLDHYGIKTRASAAELVAKARRNADLDDAAALRIAVEETRKVRRR